MQKITSITIENFKVFGKKVTINLNDPGVIIGPNNGGKTSIIQAITLWHTGFNLWYSKKPTIYSEKRNGVLIETGDIANIPITDTTDLWHNKNIRTGNNPITLTLSATILMEGKEYECGMEFYRSSAQMYAKPSSTLIDLWKKDQSLAERIFDYISNLKVGILYPMSGLSPIERVEVSGTIAVYLGQGKTGDVLRNLCWKLFSDHKDEWEYVKKTMHTLFNVSLNDPIAYIARNGELKLTYTFDSTGKELDIISGGRGQNQMLLLLCFAALNKESIILFDEPDAHLEILRQKHLYVVLQDISNKRGNQTIICTHSEVLMNKTDLINLAFLLNGKNVLSTPENKINLIRNSISEFGMEQYMQAEIKKKVIYIEGETDLKIIRSFANIALPSLKEKLDDRLYYYTTQTQNFNQGFEKEIEEINQGNETQNKKSYHTAMYHFNTIKQSISTHLKGFGFFDSDGKEIPNIKTPDGLTLTFLKRYEIENYFISEESLRLFTTKKTGTNLFNQINEEDINNAIKHAYLWLFDESKEEYSKFLSYPKDAQNDLVRAKNKKMSKFADIFFSRLAENTKNHILLEKGSYYKIVDEVYDIDSIPGEILELLEALNGFL